MAFGVSRRVLSLTTTLIVTATIVGIGSPAYADKIRDDQWHLQYLRIAEAHKISQGEGVIVAVIDTGVDNTHEDLRNNILPGTDVIAGGNGNGWGDADGHGTGMAGLIAAHGHGVNGADGMLGIAPKAKILPIRIGTKAADKMGGEDALLLGVQFAIRSGAKIISMSLSGANATFALQAEREARAAGVLMIAAAGNKPADLFLAGPANLPGVIAVGATDSDGVLGTFSMTGREVALTAPGVNIATTSRVDAGKGTKYRKANGTSDSTAIVSGVAALVWSKFPDLTASEVAWRLTTTAADKGAPGRDQEYGFGIIDPVAALTADVAASPQPSPEPTFGTAGTDAPTELPDREGLAVAARWLLAGVCLLVLAAVGVTTLLLVRRRRAAVPKNESLQ